MIFCQVDDFHGVLLAWFAAAASSASPCPPLYCLHYPPLHSHPINTYLVCKMSTWAYIAASPSRSACPSRWTDSASASWDMFWGLLVSPIRFGIVKFGAEKYTVYDTFVPRSCKTLRHSTSLLKYTPTGVGFSRHRQDSSDWIDFFCNIVICNEIIKTETHNIQKEKFRTLHTVVQLFAVYSAIGVYICNISCGKYRKAKNREKEIFQKTGLRYEQSYCDCVQRTVTLKVRLDYLVQNHGTISCIWKIRLAKNTRNNDTCFYYR